MDVCIVILCKRVLGFARWSFEGTRSLDKVFFAVSARTWLQLLVSARTRTWLQLLRAFQPAVDPYRGLNNLSEVLWYFTVELLY